MNLQWLRNRKVHHDDGSAVRHSLYDVDTDRVHGYVEEPRSDELCFLCVPYGATDRWYLKLEPAMAYLEEVTLRMDIEERRKEMDFAREHFRKRRNVAK